MADPKGTYYSAQTPEQGWATVIPQQPRSNFFKTLAQLPMAQMKAKQAEDKAKQAALAKLTADQVGRFHHDAYQGEVERLFNEAPNLNTMELQERVVSLGAMARATKDVAKMYDTDRKWAEGKDVPIKKEEWMRAYTERNYANPDMATAAQWAQNPPDKGWFLNEDGGSQYIDAARATKRVIRDNFKETLNTQTLTQGGWDKIPIGYEKNNLTLKHKLQAFAKVEGEEIVVKGYEELIAGGVLEAFTNDEYTKRVLIDKAKENQRLAGKSYADEDISNIELAQALEGLLQPYVAGAVQESGVTLTIRPVSSGGGGSSQARETGFNLWVERLSSGDPNAGDFAIGSKTEFGELVSVSPTQGKAVIKFTNPTALRQRLSQESWFKSLDENQKRQVLGDALRDVNENYDPNTPAQVYWVYTFRETVPKSSKDADAEQGAGGGATSAEYRYNVRVINPARTTRGYLALLYEGGYKVRKQHFDKVVSGGQMGTRFETPPDAWQDPEEKPKPPPKPAKPQIM